MHRKIGRLYFHSRIYLFLAKHFSYQASQSMKFIIPFIFLPILSIAQVSGPRWYIKTGAGYGTKGFLPAEFTPKSIVPATNSLAITDGTIQDMTNGVDSIGQRAYVHDTYTKGFNYYIGGGYKLSKYWGVELGVLWLQGGSITSKLVFENNPLLGKGATMNVNTYARGLAVIPAITVDIPLGEKWFIQGRAGFSIPVYGAIYHKVNLDGPHALLGHASAVVESETQASFSLGVNGGIGIHRKLGKRFEVFVDLLAQHLNLNGKHLVVKRYDLTIKTTTTDQLETTKGAYHSEINFVKELTQTSNNKQSNPKIDETRPKDDLVVTSPFSNVGVGIGVAFKLGKGE